MHMTDRTTWEELKGGRPRTVEGRAAYEDEARISAFRELVYRLRTEAGITEADLAARMGTTQSAIARMEGGGTRPTLETLEKIASAIGADLVVGVGRTSRQPEHCQALREGHAVTGVPGDRPVTQAESPRGRKGAGGRGCASSPRIGAGCRRRPGAPCRRRGLRDRSAATQPASFTSSGEAPRRVTTPAPCSPWWQLLRAPRSVESNPVGAHRRRLAGRRRWLPVPRGPSSPPMVAIPTSAHRPVAPSGPLERRRPRASVGSPRVAGQPVGTIGWLRPTHSALRRWTQSETPSGPSPTPLRADFAVEAARAPRRHGDGRASWSSVPGSAPTVAANSAFTSVSAPIHRGVATRSLWA